MAFVGSAIIGGAALASAGINAYASSRASSQQVAAEREALAAQNAARAKLDPYINIGTGATYSLGQLYGIGQDGQSTPQNADYSQFYNSPDYQFAQQQGELGLTRSLNARGMNMSGGALKDFAQFNQGLATQQFGNYYNRLLSLSQLGGNAAQAGIGGANAAANTMGQIGQSQASGTVGMGNALSGGINSGINNSLLYNAINRSAYAPAGQTFSGNGLQSSMGGGFGGGVFG